MTPETTVKRIDELFHGDLFYQVPAFQRGYSWEEDKWTEFWKMITELEGDETRLLGFVLVSSPEDFGINKVRYQIVDGQQRLVTISLLLCAFRDRCFELGTEEIGDTIQQYLSGDREGVPPLRLELNNPHQKDYSRIMEQNDPSSDSSKITKCYEYFLKKSRDIQIEELQKYLGRILNSVAVVMVSTENTGDFFRLFHTEKRLREVRIEYAINELKELIDAEKNEQAYQSFFEDHPGFFGPKYNRRVERNLTKHDEIDLALESINGYLDVIELKKPQHIVVNYDNSHGNYYPNHELTKAISQVQNYIYHLEREENRIFSQDGLHVLKPRGIIVIGHNLTEEEREGLRIINSHLNRVEILTYDEVLTMGEQMKTTLWTSEEQDI